MRETLPFISSIAQGRASPVFWVPYEARMCLLGLCTRLSEEKKRVAAIPSRKRTSGQSLGCALKLPVRSGCKDDNHGKQAAVTGGCCDGGIGADRETHDTR